MSHKHLTSPTSRRIVGSRDRSIIEKYVRHPRSESIPRLAVTVRGITEFQIKLLFPILQFVSFESNEINMANDSFRVSIKEISL